MFSFCGGLSPAQVLELGSDEYDNCEGERVKSGHEPLTLGGKNSC